MPSPTENPTDHPPLHLLRGYRVILDADLARLYGVTTKQLNQTVRRNPERFPSDLAFQLIPEEWEELNRSQIVTASPPNPSQPAIGSPSDPMRSQTVIASPVNDESSQNSQIIPSQSAIAPPAPSMWSQSVTTSGEGSNPRDADKFRRATHLPWAFTEHGALMAGTILRSPRAVQMSLYVVRAFVKLRQIAMENETLSRRMLQAEVALREHDVLLTDIYDKLEPLLEPEPDQAPKRKMGFQVNEPRPT